MKNLIMVMMAVVISLPLYASNFQSGKVVTISKPVEGDLYIAGGTIVINAPINGDLIVGGGNITLNDTVTNDLIIGGGKVMINGYVGDDIRGASGEITLNGGVGGDLILTGGTILITQNTVVSGSLISAGGNITLQGTVNGHLKCLAGELELDGTVGQSAECRGDKIVINGSIKGNSVMAANDITVGDRAAFYNGIRYWSGDEKLDMSRNIKGGKALFDPSLQLQNEKLIYLGFGSVLGLLWYLGAVYVMILLLQFLFGNLISKGGEMARLHTGKSFVYGLLYFILVPVAAVILMMTLIGIPIGFLLLLFYLIAGILATIIISLVIANLIKSSRGYQWTNWHIANVAMAVFIAVKFIFLVPIIGWLAMALCTCLAFGGIMVYTYTHSRKVAIN